jgi:trk system potassium uptake protein
LTWRLSAPRLIALGFAVFMVLGTLLLKLPASTYEGISWVDALFVSVSAASVTGLSSVEFSDTFTRFGSITVMVLIQVRGLGIMTFTIAIKCEGQRATLPQPDTLLEEGTILVLGGAKKGLDKFDPAEM